MTIPSVRLRFLLLGEQSLLQRCAELLLERGHQILAVVTAESRLVQFCAQRGLPQHFDFEALRGNSDGFDHLLSITNLRMLPGWLLQQPAISSINFHDGPLPRHAGLNAPAWALLEGAETHGVTWHEMTAVPDDGRILVQREFQVLPDDTAFSLNARCYEVGLESFAELVQQLESRSLAPTKQDPALRSYHGLADRPKGNAVLDWARPAEELARLVRALDFGRYPNPLLLPKLDLGDELLLVREAQVAEAADGPPGRVGRITATSVEVHCGSGTLAILRLTTASGRDVDIARELNVRGISAGSMLPAVVPSGDLDRMVAVCARHERKWVDGCASVELAKLPLGSVLADDTPALLAAPAGGRTAAESRIAQAMLLLARLNDLDQVSVVLEMPRAAKPALRRHFAGMSLLTLHLQPGDTLADWTSRVAAQLADESTRLGWLADLPARYPALRDSLEAIAQGAVRIQRIPELPRDVQAVAFNGAALVICIDDTGNLALATDGRRMDRSGAARLLDCWSALREGARDPQVLCSDVSVVSAAERHALQPVRVADGVVATPDSAACIPRLVEAAVERNPARIACIDGGQAVSYAELNAQANRLARHLVEIGVRPGDLVGVHVPRSIGMMVALLAIHKAGAAYVPLDPNYPAGRLSYMIDDASLRVVISRSDVAGGIGAKQLVLMDALPMSCLQAAGNNLETSPGGSDLAYVIYTSGSTGNPKGVMVEHRNVLNFFAGMDGRLGAEPGVWLAVTSISFDISVLELFWTLSRGHTVVINGDAPRHGSRKSTSAAVGNVLDFSLFYWNVASKEQDEAADKYRLLLDSARFADANGFTAVWTPERHFESFGGLYPNPAVTAAALATITRHVHLRAGSCVAPLHSPIRIAEEWAVVDNLSGGRVGIAMASGWAAPDFAIRPENFATAKQVMFETMEAVRKLWRGEAVAFPGPLGEVAVRTLPRPVQKELPLWITTAGNVDTCIEAGKRGANMLTHLLGQSIDDVAARITAYRRARAQAGHSGRGTVTLMLHTLVGPDMETVERLVREPMKAYLRSAINLVKSASWQFPTFRKLSAEQGKSLDEFFASAGPEEMDELLEFAFQRYFRTSGLFGTPQSSLEILETVQAAGVDEVACLIDFGVDTDVVLQNLPYLAELRELARQKPANHNAVGALLHEHAVTHLQCTPSMISLLLEDPQAQQGLRSLRHLMVGGEPMVPALAQRLTSLVSGQVSNLYGPTETTVWSAAQKVSLDSITPSGTVAIGSALANQQLHVLDSRLRLLPRGAVGEITIGGAGVTRGYLNRAELTAERFVPDNFAALPGSRMYRTGDLGRVLEDGRTECLGRKDQQIKIRGYRVEMGEIEAALRQFAGVREAAVVMNEAAAGDQRLTACLCMSGELDARELREYLRLQLPDYMVPAHFIVLPTLPRTLNGKLDRLALARHLPAGPMTVLPAAGSGAASPPPQDSMQGLVQGIWQRVLGVTGIGLRDNFFDIGGHSLLIIQVLKELQGRTARPIHMTDLFRFTTIESLAQFLSGAVAAEEPAMRGRSRADARRTAQSKRG